MHLSVLLSSHRKPLLEANHQKSTWRQLATFSIHLVPTTLTRLTAIHGRTLLEDRSQGTQPSQLWQFQIKRLEILLEGAGDTR